jgi:predicted dehydrogenase
VSSGSDRRRVTGACTMRWERVYLPSLKGVNSFDMIVSIRFQVAGYPASDWRLVQREGNGIPHRRDDRAAWRASLHTRPPGVARGIDAADVRNVRSVSLFFRRVIVARLGSCSSFDGAQMTSSSDRVRSGERIRVGLVGIGNWAQHGHVRVLSLLPQYELSAIYSQRREAAVTAAHQYGFNHVVDSLNELVGHPEVDLVIVLTTAPQHEEAVRAAIAAGKDVYCEWPLTTSTGASGELVEFAREKGVRHIVGLQRRLAPHNRYVRDLLVQEYVGKLRSVRMHVSMNYFQARRSSALRWTAPPENFSSVIAIYAGHFLDMLFAATGWPTSIAGLAVNQFRNVVIAETGEVIPTSTPDQLVLGGTLANDAVLSVHIEGGKRNGSGVQIDITGDRGDIRITNVSAFGGVGDDYRIEGAHGDNLPLQVLPVPDSYLDLPPSELPSAVLELAELYAAYARDLAGGTQEAATFEDAVRMHKLLDAAFESSRSGRRIELD